LLLIGFILIVVGLIVVGFRGFTGSEERPVGSYRGGGILALVGVLLFVFGLSVREVGPGQVGVKVVFNQVQDDELPSGIHLTLPIFTDIVSMDARVRSYPFTDIEAFTRENQPARLVGIVNYHIDASRAAALFREYNIDYEKKLVESQADTQLKELSRSFGVDEITARRDDLGIAVQESLQALVDPWITIDGVFIRDIGLSADYIASVEQKQVAQQNLARADIEANTARTKAQGDADAQAIRADGQARANERIVQSLTPELIQWETIHRLADKVRIALVPPDSGFIWNLNGITADASPQP
jgi:regulator of protease activity HflC (stomatin/prohibitin superfamily)